MASTRVVLPWSTWATMATLRRSSRVCMGMRKGSFLLGMVPLRVGRLLSGDMFGLRVVSAHPAKCAVATMGGVQTDQRGDPGSERGLVMVVEDEEAIVSVLRMYLTREGFSVHAVGDGAAALWPTSGGCGPAP